MTLKGAAMVLGNERDIQLTVLAFATSGWLLNTAIVLVACIKPMG